LAFGTREAAREREGAAASDRALDGNVAAELPHESLDDRQPEPGAAVAARCRVVGLLERVEDAIDRAAFDADSGVSHRDAERPAVARRSRCFEHDAHASALGELDGVADQVVEHLLQAHRIAACAGVQVGGNADRQREPLLRCHRAEQRPYLRHDLAQVQVALLELQLAGLQLGQVEDVVDDAHQRHATGLDGARKPCLLVVEVRIEQQARDPQNAVQRRADLVAHVGEEGTLRKQRLLHFGKSQCELVARVTVGRLVLARAGALAVGSGLFAPARHQPSSPSSSAAAVQQAQLGLNLTSTRAPLKALRVTES
jgi:hypothetical protein